MRTKKKSLAHYAELYGLPLGTIANCRRRKWPLDDPEELFRRFTESPGKKPDLRTLETIVCGENTERVKSKEFQSEDDAPTLMSELDHLRKECRRSFADFENEPSPIRRVQLHKVYLQNLKALSALVPLATKAEEEAGRLVSADAVVQQWMRATLEFRAALETIPRRIATHPVFRKLDPVEVEAVLNHEVATVLEQLRRQADPTGGATND